VDRQDKGNIEGRKLEEDASMDGSHSMNGKGRSVQKLSFHQTELTMRIENIIYDTMSNLVSLR